MIHLLITNPFYFIPMIRGEKKFEIRINTDHGFQKGDMVRFEEYATDGYPTGRGQLTEITYVTNQNQPANQVVFGFSLVGEVTTVSSDE